MAGAVFAVLAAQGFGPAVTAGSWALNSDDANTGSYAYRVNLSVSATGKQVRVTFNAASAAAMVCTHASVGITATAPNTAATPIELKFGGASGFSLSGGQSIVSDWCNIDITSGGHILVDMDMTTANLRYLNTATGSDIYFKSGAADYANATVTGYTSALGRADGVSLVEVRA